MPGEGPKEVSLVRKVPGAGYTFILAGVLKIMTIGWVATSAPHECVRTVAGQYAQLLLVPIGILLCFLAKRIVDSGLNENTRFMRILMGLLVLLYFGLPAILYRYEPKTYAAQQRLLAAATHARTSDYDYKNMDPRRKFIIQRQLDGEYDPQLRTPELALNEVDARIPTGAVYEGGGRALRPSAAARPQQPVVPSMYTRVERVPGMDASASE